MGYVTYRERIIIETLLKKKTSVAEIASYLGRSRQTVYNELKQGRVILKDTLLRDYVSYSADISQQKHDFAQTNKGRSLKIGNDHAYAAYLEHKIKVDRYSPAAALAAARNTKRFKTNISRVTLYSYIYNGFINVSADHLLHGCRSKKCYSKVTPHKVLEAPGIDKRPGYINDRSELGHWEMDCVCSPQGKTAALLTLTEHCSRHELIFKIPNKEMKTVVGVLDRL